MKAALKTSGEKVVNALCKILAVILIVYWIAFGGLIVERLVIKTFVYPIKYKEEVQTYSKEYDLDMTLVFSIIKEESGFDKNAVSKKGAVGLMQLRESTAQEIANEKRVATYDLKNAKTNIDFGCYYLRYLIDKFQSEDTAIVAYNAGEGNVTKWLNDYRYSADGKTLINIPFPESNAYLKRVKDTYKKYKKLYIIFLDKER